MTAGAIGLASVAAQEPIESGLSGLPGLSGLAGESTLGGDVGLAGDWTLTGDAGLMGEAGLAADRTLAGDAGLDGDPGLAVSVGAAGWTDTAAPGDRTLWSTDCNSTVAGGVVWSSAPASATEPNPAPMTAPPATATFQVMGVRMFFDSSSLGWLTLVPILRTRGEPHVRRV